MPLTLTEKQAVVAEVNEQAKAAISAIVADYRGLSVSQMTSLRAKARESDVYLRVVRNTLTRRAFKDTEYECMSDILVGPLFVAFSKDAPGTAARLLKDFAKEHDKLEVKGIALSGKLLDGSQLDAVAKLPNRDEALSLLMAVMKAPTEKFVRTLNEPVAKLVRTLAAVRDQKQNG